ncbi:MAG: RluA family pseudouridine synthase [Candidatus Aminicenantes bacterium]|nr:RluA family pseudouridine synthase [Candidatus Aminicenantes bacterium]
MKKRIFKAEYSFHRLDHFLKDSLESVSRSRIEKYISGGHVKINGILCNKKNKDVVKGSVVEISFPSEKIKYSLEGFSFSKLYEDEHLLIINKPQGISVHRGAGINEPTIADYFQFNYPDSKTTGDSERPGIVHRLDKGTSGVLILAKSVKAFSELQKKFKKREIKKTYCAIVKGKMRFINGHINSPIKRNPKDRRKFTIDPGGESINSKDALTHYRTRYEFQNSTYIFIEPHSGRTHQIRVHMSSLGNSVLGDDLYGEKSSFPRLALHAYSISFSHPVHKSRIIYSHAPIPQIFRDYFQNKLNTDG